MIRPGNLVKLKDPQSDQYDGLMTVGYIEHEMLVVHWFVGSTPYIEKFPRERLKKVK